MQRSEAEALAVRLMAEYGLEDWTFSWMSRKKTLGLCHHLVQCIQLSTIFVDHNDVDVVEQTIRHEIAHALVGAGKGHGYEWRAMAYQVGCRDPRATCGEAILPLGRYQATCGRCAKVYSMDRRPKASARRKYCSLCFRVVEDIEVAALEFIDTRFNVSVHHVPSTPENVLLSAAQSAPVQSVESVANSAPRSYTAPQLAEAMRVDAKSFRAWLRKRPDIAYEYKNGSGYLFNDEAARFIMRLWADTH